MYTISKNLYKTNVSVKRHYVFISTLHNGHETRVRTYRLRGPDDDRRRVVHGRDGDMDGRGGGACRGAAVHHLNSQDVTSGVTHI